MLPESLPVLKEKAAEQFEKYDRKPLDISHFNNGSQMLLQAFSHCAKL